VFDLPQYAQNRGAASSEIIATVGHARFYLLQGFANSSVASAKYARVTELNQTLRGSIADASP